MSGGLLGTGLDASEDPPAASVGLAGGVAPVSVGVPIDTPALGEAVEGESKPDASVGNLGGAVLLSLLLSMGNALSPVEVAEGGFTSDASLESEDLPLISSQTRNYNHG